MSILIIKILIISKNKFLTTKTAQKRTNTCNIIFIYERLLGLLYLIWQKLRWPYNTFINRIDFVIIERMQESDCNILPARYGYYLIHNQIVTTIRQVLSSINFHHNLSRFNNEICDIVAKFTDSATSMSYCHRVISVCRLHNNYRYFRKLCPNWVRVNSIRTARSETNANIYFFISFFKITVIV